MEEKKTALILGIGGHAGQREEPGVLGWVVREEVLPDVRGNCENCRAEIQAIPDWDKDLGYYWPKTCPNCGATLYLPGTEPRTETAPQQES